MKNKHYHIYSQQCSLKPEETPVEPQDKKQQTEAKKQSPSIGKPFVLSPSLASFIAYILLMFLPVISIGYASSFENKPDITSYYPVFGGYYSPPEHMSRDARGHIEQLLSADFWGFGADLTVKEMIQNGADVNDHDKLGNTPLMVASQYALILTDIVALIEHGAEVNARNEDGWTPLMFAS